MVRPARFDVRRISLGAIAPAVWFSELGVPAWWDDRRGTLGGDGVMAYAGVEGAVGRDLANLLLGRDLIEQFRQ